MPQTSKNQYKRNLGHLQKREIMGKKSQLYVFNRDNLIVGIIRQHEGLENAIKSTEIVKLLKDKGYNTKSESIHTIMSKIIRERNLPIVS